MKLRIAAGQPEDIGVGSGASSASGEKGRISAPARAPACEHMRIDEGERRVPRQRDALAGRRGSRPGAGADAAIGRAAACSGVEVDVVARRDRPAPRSARRGRAAPRACTRPRCRSGMATAAPCAAARRGRATPAAPIPVAAPARSCRGLATRFRMTPATLHVRADSARSPAPPPPRSAPDRRTSSTSTTGQPIARRRCRRSSPVAAGAGSWPRRRRGPSTPSATHRSAPRGRVAAARRSASRRHRPGVEVERRAARGGAVEGRVDVVRSALERLHRAGRAVGSAREAPSMTVVLPRARGGAPR